VKTTWTKAKNIRAGESIETTAGVAKVLSVQRIGAVTYLRFTDPIFHRMAVRSDSLLSRVGPSITSRSHPDHPRDCTRACCKYIVPPMSTTSECFKKSRSKQA
jgi:hypothetical protein